MFELGKKQELIVMKEKGFGVYLREKEDDSAMVLLPIKEVPQGTKIGDALWVFIYKDSDDRLIATTNEPKLMLGETAVLTVKETSRIGAFLDMGLEKDLLLPFREQNHRIEAGEECLVALYVDKSRRLAATMYVYPYLSRESPYKKDDWVEARVYENNENLGAFVAVQDKYFGLIPRKELYRYLRPGEVVRARVTKVREDGKLDLSLRDRAHLQIGTDAEKILSVIARYDGALPFNDKVSPEIIREEFSLSKNAFKRAVGHLLKEGKIEITGTSIRRIG